MRQAMFENLTPRTPLPSLTALRAFEAMARLGSATRAAAELNVTHSAVSRQVKALEGQLGQALFKGPRHALKLTPAGEALLPGLTSGFDALASAVSGMGGEGQDLYVAVNASLSVKWLIPRLPDFNLRHPDLNLHLVELAPHAKGLRGADVILRLAEASQIELLGGTALLPNAIGPVIAPPQPGLNARQACLNAPRLIPRTHPQGWQVWADIAQVTLPPVAPRPVAHLHFALDAALSGWGAAVLPWVLTAEAVLAGTLVAPWGFVQEGGAICVMAGSGPDTRARRLFLRWLTDQAHSMPPAPPGITIPALATRASTTPVLPT